MIQLKPDDIEAVLDVLGPLLPGVDIAVEVRDPDDVMVVGAALAGARPPS